MPGRFLRLAAAVLACSMCIGAADITLVKHARRVQPQPSDEYVVQPGDTLSSILVKVYRARQDDLPALYRQFRLLNPSILDLNTIQVGAKIKIPLGNRPEQGGKPDGMEVRRVAPDEYVIKQGEHLAKILRDLYGIPDEVVFRQYIDLVKQLNPEITNPDQIRAGQGGGGGLR
ncbi:MAG TPA: LysM domain-containing protein, partial [Deltaproteobacteria bacterium]|nr:LysM domain-containing protein [Deltaproteobacteria bacterium]